MGYIRDKFRDKFIQIKEVLPVTLLFSIVYLPECLPGVQYKTWQ